MESKQGSNPILSLLIVEDDKTPREIVSLMVSKKFPNVAVFSAENGKIGVDLFNEHRPDIVITDINMPVMDGIQMAGEIKRIKADTRFIVLTGYNDDDYLKKFREIGIGDYMLKPIEFGKLFDAIEKCIDEIMLKRQ